MKIAWLFFAAYKALRVVNANVGSNAFTGTVNITILVIATYKKFKKERTIHLTRFSLKQGEPGTSQYLYLGQKWPKFAQEKCNLMFL